MSVRVAEQVEDWDSRSFAGGYGELSRLADAEFSGAIWADGAELFMTKGVVVGVQSGTIESFEAGGTTYEAPSPALPLLAVMQNRSDEVRAKYYTEKTPISAVDQTLSEGGFTGFVVLSENVLSGEYYLVYHAGRSMSVAFVGESERLLTGEEAFETADDEVGLYEVRPVEIDSVEIPEPESDTAPGPASDPDPTQSTKSSGTETGAQTDSETGSDAPSESSATPAGSNKGGPASGPDRTDGASAVPTNTGAEPESEPGSETAATEKSASDPRADTNSRQETDNGSMRKASASGTEPTAEDDRRESADPDTHAGSEQATSESSAQRTESQTRDASGSRDRRQPQQRTQDPVGGTSADPGTSGDAGRSGQNEQPEVDADLKTIAIPSIDPSRTQTNPQRQPSGQSRQATGGAPMSTQAPPQPDDTADTSTAQTETQARSQTQTQIQPEESAPDPQRVAELEATLEDRAKKIERLESALSEATDERDQLREQLGDLKDERDALTDEIERLEDELATLERELGAQTDAERRLSPGEALAGTDLFVRYGSKGDTTLAKAHDGAGRQSDVVENLRLETHTQFDAEAVSVGGQTYEAFFTETAAYQFAQWLIQDLLFEIRSTGSETALQTLYDAIPAIDRVEFAGTVEAIQTENGQETRTEEGFDLVFRNRMGEPLVAANLNDSLEAASEGMMEELLTAARRIGQSSDTFAGAFLVTTSFFEPGALETASEATKSGFLSRDKRKSYVTLSRKRGFHLCLVEARDQKFNLAVPEL